MWNIIGEFCRTYGLQIIATALIGYLLGSISFSIIITRKFEQKADIRTMGSGNAGFTNVLRSVGKLPATLTLIGDFGKGVVAVLIGKLIFQFFAITPDVSFTVAQYGAYLAGFACLMGHLFPCYFGFRGGKGVLTTAAMMLLIDWRVFLIEIAIVLIIFLIFRIISLSSVIAACLYPVSTFMVTYFIDYLPNHRAGADYPLSYVVITTLVALLIGVVVIVKHRQNIKRILAGTEKRITPKKRTA